MVHHRHRRASFVSLLKEQLGVNSKDNPHKDNMKSEMKKSDKKVRAVMQSFKGFQNPFEMTGEDSPFSFTIIWTASVQTS